MLETIKKEIQGSGRPDIDVVEVTIKLDEHSLKRIASHYASFERTWTKESLTPSFDIGEFTRYIYTAFKMRCDAQHTSLKEYSQIAKRMKIPSLIYLVLEQLGYVQIKEIGLTLIPKFEPTTIGEGEESETIQPLEPEDMELISLHLQELENLGHEMARGLPRDDGSIEFMLMETESGTLKTSDPKAHPVYAFLKSFITSSNLQDYIISRVKWLERDEYGLAYDSLIRSRNG